MNDRVQQLRRVATITLLSDESVVETRATANKFQLVAALPGETIRIVVPTAVTERRTVSNYATVQPLDGGTLLGPSAVPVIDGAATIQFQVGTQPGLYRVLFLDLGPPVTAQFWVRSIQRSATSPWTVNASHWETQ
jgi:hypothetical protein